VKICHFIASRGIGRGEFYIDLVNELSKSEKIYLLIPSNSNYLERISDNIIVLEYKSKNSRKNPFLIYEIYQKIKSINPDIVHTHFSKSSEIFFFINKLLKIFHIATKHNPRKGEIFDRLKYVTAVSKDVAKSIKNNSTVIYNGITPIKIEKQKTKNKKFTISAIGRLDKVKGFDLLIENLEKIKFDFELNIVGNGKERKNLKKLIKKLKLEKKVSLLGFKKNIPQIITNSDLIIVSSLNEGFSLVILEAIFYSKLLITTKVGIAKEIFTEQFIVKNFDFYNKLNDIYLNYDEYTNSFKLFQEEIKNKFLLQNIAKEYVKYYKKVSKFNKF